jgi:hypothetical protein
MKQVLPILLLIILWAFLHLFGIGWGVPNEHRILLVFGDRWNLEGFVPAMLQTHEELREMQTYYGQTYRSDYRYDEKLCIEAKSRSYKITRELINSMRSYLIRSYGADEQAAIVSLSRMKPSHFQFNPHFFEYGGAYLYPMGFLFKICAVTGTAALKSDLSYYLLNPEKLGVLYVIGRFWGACGALLAILVLYAICCRIMKNRGYAFLLSLCFGACPAIVIWSHFLKPFSYGLGFVMCALWAIVVYLENHRARYIFLASFFAGLSFGTLLSYGYIFLAVISAVLLHHQATAQKIRYLLYCFAIFLGTFFITNPYVLISAREFFLELAYLHDYWKHGGGVASLVFFTTHSIRLGMGEALWILALMGLITAMLGISSGRFMYFAILIIPGFLYFGITTGKWVHYGLVLYPILFLIIACHFTEHVARKVALPIMIIAFMYTLFCSLCYLTLFNEYGGRKNVRDAAGEWINKNIPEGVSVGMLEAPSPWRTPPFEFFKYNVKILSNRDKLENEQPEYFVISQYQWGRGSSFAQIEQFLIDYTVLEDFAMLPVYPFYFRRDSRSGRLPYDWFHPNPEIVIWKRKN